MLYQRLLLWIDGLRYRRHLLVPTPPLLWLWRSIGFRYLAWWTARATGAVWRWANSGWRPPILMLVGVGIVWAFATTWSRNGKLIGAKFPWSDLLTISTFLNVLVVAVLLGLVRQAYQARRRLVVLPFNNYAGDDCKPFVAGLAERLVSELRRLNDSYRTIDEINPSIQIASGSAINVTVTVEDVGEILRGAVSADSKIKLGPIEIPIGPLAGLFAGFVRGPRLSGSLHRSGDRFVLIAGIEAGAAPRTWRAEGIVPPAPAGSRDPALDAVVDELVYRVFTDIVPVGSRKWEAVRLYSRGLEAFRRTLATGRDRVVHLSRAERLFIQALTEDKTFARCHYNLGVVYNELANSASARAAFERALAENPALADAAYGLAAWHYARNNFTDALTFAQRAVALQPTDARPWQLIGLAQKGLRQGWIGRTLQPRTDTVLWFDIIHIREIAAALAWRGLCGGILRGDDISAAQQTVARCFNDAAVAWMMAGWPRHGRSILRQSMTQSRFGTHYFEIGKCWAAYGRYDKAVDSFRRALLLSDDLEYWGNLADAEAQRFSRAKVGSTEAMLSKAAVLWAYQRIMVCPSAVIPEVSGEAGKLLASACKALSRVDRAAGRVAEADWEDQLADRVSMVPTVLDDVKQKPGEDRAAWVARLEQWTGQLRSELAAQPATPDKPAWAWPFAFVASRLAYAVADDGEHGIARADDLLREAVGKLADQHPAEIVRQKFHSELSLVALIRNNLATALAEAKEAVALVPHDADARYQLGRAYLALQDHQRAQEEFEISLELDPSNTNVLDALAAMYLTRGVALRDPVRRREAYLNVIKSYGDIASALSNTKEAGDFERQGRLHFWMGRLHAALQQWNQAAYHLKIALEMKFSPLHGRLTLGFIYLEQQAYNEAESEFRTLVTEARRTLVRLRSAAAAAGADAKTVKDALLGTCTSGNPGDEMPINELLLRNNLLLARVFTERGLDDARASRLIRHARRRLKHTSGDTRRELEARCSDYQGWADRAVGRLDDALRHLEASIRIYADAESYYHLTTTCLDLAEAQAQAPLRKKWVARAEWHHKQLTAVDVEREFARGAEEIEARLAALRKELAKSDKKTDGDGAAKPEPKTEPTAEPETG